MTKFPPPAFKHLLLDLDGTLLGSHQARLKFHFLFHTVRFLRSYTRSSFTALQLIKLMRVAAETHNTNATNLQRICQSLMSRLQIDEETAKKILKAISEEIFPKLKNDFYVMPDAIGFTQWSQNHFELSLATNPFWTEEVVKLRLGWAKIAPDIFSFITHAGSSHSVKPQLNYYREVVQRTGRPPSECLLIGDSMKKDLPATEAQIPVYILSSSSKTIPLKSFGANAWTGNYSALKYFLQQSLASS